MIDTTLAPRPDHVAPDRVFAFDLYNRDPDHRLEADLHRGLADLLRHAPDVFWTPFNGGHWVVSRFALLQKIVVDTMHFSTSVMQVPPPKDRLVAIPLTIDPPAHGGYRQIVMQFLAPKVVKEMEQDIRARAAALIDAVASEGECDFVDRIGIPFPVGIFMDLIGWPVDRMKEFRALADEFFSGPSEQRLGEIIQCVQAEMARMLDERIAQPGGDMMSGMLAAKYEGRNLSREEILSMCFFFFVAGLDTVANAAGFFFRVLAMSSHLQRELVEEPDRIKAFVDEALRTCGVVNSIRTVKKRVELGGVEMREGDMVVLMFPMAGLDPGVHDDPERFDMERSSHANLIFGSGVHLCAGHHLARTELRILVDEWLKRIPEFTLASDDRHSFRLGTVMALRSLKLRWPTENVRRVLSGSR